MLAASIDKSPSTGPLVVVAMSGGVDSCAAAVLLAEQGCTVVGVSMQVWDYRKNGGNAHRATCCAPSDFNDARRVSDAVGFPFYVFNFEETFQDEVIAPFVRSYLNGQTPNPCVDCNRRVKFHALRERARSFGAHAVATGHYAQIRHKSDGMFGLYTARDTAKDQSYFLYALSQRELAETLFPIGGLTKPEVRRLLDEKGFSVAQKRESQDICFVSESAGAFVERELARNGETVESRRGAILHADGSQLGEHDGIHHFTVGQRRGLRAGGASERLYVLQIDADSNTVTVGKRSDLEREDFSVGDLHWTTDRVVTDPFECTVKVRYRHSGSRCRVTPIFGDRVQVTFLDDWSPISPGQAAVFYAKTAESDGVYEVLGGGTILTQQEATSSASRSISSRGNLACE